MLHATMLPCYHASARRKPSPQSSGKPQQAAVYLLEGYRTEHRQLVSSTFGCHFKHIRRQAAAAVKRFIEGLIRVNWGSFRLAGRG